MGKALFVVHIGVGMIKKTAKSVGNLLCSSKNVSIFAADFAAHVLLTIDAHALVKSRV